MRCPYCTFQLPALPRQKPAWWKNPFLLGGALLAGLALIAAAAALALAILPGLDFFRSGSPGQVISLGQQTGDDEPARSPGAWDESATRQAGHTLAPTASLMATLTTAPTATGQGLATHTPVRLPTRTLTLVLTRTPTRTASPTPETGEWEACPESYPSRLHKGDRAYVSFDPPLSNRVRAKPDSDSVIEGTIDPGDKVKITDGPVCAENWVWWKISAENEYLVGWTSEGDFEGYWLVPLPE